MQEYKINKAKEQNWNPRAVFCIIASQKFNNYKTSNLYEMWNTRIWLNLFCMSLCRVIASQKVMNFQNLATVTLLNSYFLWPFALRAFYFFAPSSSLFFVFWALFLDFAFPVFLLLLHFLYTFCFWHRLLRHSTADPNNQSRKCPLLMKIARWRSSSWAR